MIEEQTTSDRPTSDRSEGIDAESELSTPGSDANADASPESGDLSGLTHGTTVLTSKGQVTVPANVRRRLGLEPGHRLTFTVLADGTTVMRAKTRSIGDLAGSIEPGTDRRASIDELGFG